MTKNIFLFRISYLVAVLVGVASVSVASAQSSLAAATSTKTIELWDGLLTLQVPPTADAPTKLAKRAYSIKPRSAKRKFVIVASREPLLKDEVKMTNSQLAKSVADILRAQGHEVIRLSVRKNEFTVDFRAFATVPWQKVGTSPTRGVAKFIRTEKNELVGSALYCDPKQWRGTATTPFKRVVTTAKVS